jgi:hypothetical protein
MFPMRELRPWMLRLLGTVILASGCQSEVPLLSEPERGNEAHASATATLPSTRAGLGAAIDPEARLAEELARIAMRQEQEQTVYDSLKVVWQQVLDDTTGRYADSLMCDPKQYVATAKIIGPDGGDINFGEHTLRIPAGALSAATVITAEAPTSLRVTSVFSPHGTQFNAGHSPTLELSYKHCRGPLHRAARIAYVGANGTILEWPPSEDHPELGLVRALIAHFSNYIVAY